LVIFVASYLSAVYWVFTKSTPLIDERKITVRLAHWQIEKGPPEGIDAVIARYEELNPEVRVQQVKVPGQVYRQWMRANFAGNNAPDIVEYGAWLDGLADLPVRYFDPLTKDLLKPNPYNEGTTLEGLPWLNTFVDELQEQRVNSPEPGQYYAVTLTQISLRLFCNVNLLRKITGSPEPPVDFDEMRGLFAKVADYSRRQQESVVPFGGSRDNANWMMVFYMGGIANGVTQKLDTTGILGLYARETQWKYLRGDWSYQMPAIKAGLSLLGELSDQMQPGYMGFLRDEAVRQFLRGEALFLFAGTWEATSLRQLADFPVEVWRCPQPSVNDPVVGKQMIGHYADGSSVTSFGLYLNKRSPNRAAAVDFLRYLTSYEGNKIFMEKSGWLPSIKDVPVAPEIASFLSPDDGYAFGGVNINFGGGTRAVFERNFYLMVGPEGSVDKFAAALDRDMPEAARGALAVEGRAARWAVLPQDSRVVALEVLMATDPGNPALALRRERLEAAQNLSESRALLIARQLEMIDAGKIR